MMIKTTNLPSPTSSRICVIHPQYDAQDCFRSENVLYAQVIVDQMEKSSNRLSADSGLEDKGCEVFVLLTAGRVATLLKQYRNI